ncbi:SPOR domain-containing protein [Thalassovita sp.]|uniref:SPOR domain-containing protein n=1 Tax=Thalassovita sp. TaxID=1979401 RepID=UPI0028811C36|nr:SPOR domain-containing protein [Thalassovita sp.]MDF1801270.1 SPOR domain-containing protein [Thalassovita sp.]
MAEIQANGGFDASEDGIALGAMANWAGAAVSLALVVGVGIWGYSLVTRDVSGIPVVRAAEGPMRIQPENPGGADAVHQGLAVNMVAATGGAEEPADRLILAPKPIDLTEDDVPQGVLATTAAPTPASPDGNMSVEDLVDSLTKDADPLEKVEPVRMKVPEVAPPAIKGGLARSLRPHQRPSGLRTVVAAPATSLATETVDISASSLPAGTRLAQLGAYESAKIARQEWDRLFARFGDYMEDKKRVIQKAESGGRTFYRLRAQGFGDINDARRFCSALVAEKAECIPVTTR